MILRADLADQSKPNTLYFMLACENAFSAISSKSILEKQISLKRSLQMI